MGKQATPGRGRPRKRQSGRSKARILDGAEKLFALHGFQGVSVRAIAKEAGVNVALINYYFGSKVGLLNAVFERRAAPIIAQRDRTLEACVERARETGRLDVADIIKGYLDPVLLTDQEGASTVNLQRMMGLAISDPSPEMRRAIHRIFNQVASRFIEMLREACPDLAPAELHWRLVCLFGAMIYLFADPGRVQRLVGPGFDSTDKEAALASAVPFLVAGMLAPPALALSKDKRGPARKKSRRRPAKALDAARPGDSAS